MTERDLPKPAWVVLNEKVTEDGSAAYYHVKLSQKHITRLLPTPEKPAGKFVETEYVNVSSIHRTITDATGTFTYNEAAVTASDESGKEFEGFLYVAQRHLALEEILFAIGEL